MRVKSIRLIYAFAIIAAFAFSAAAQGVKRVVIVKIDGLPSYYVDRFVKQRDPETGRSVLPWFDEVFYKNGTRLPNFYTRGMSLSGPAWGQLDTGQHLQIKGNVEYDRYTLHAYDYLNFFPYYMNYGLKKVADMPAVEVMDQLGIPLFADAFPYDRRYTSQQLYQRGNNWEVLGSGFIKLYPGNPGDFIDEWTLGLNFRKVTIDQAERDIIGKLVRRPEIDYYDYYDVSLDHVSHHNNDTASRLNGLRDLDRLIGKLWVAISSSSRADETALVLVSDHGFNSEENVYSQGFNLVKLLASSSGGAHHVITKRRLMLDYSVKGLYPLVPLIKTSSAESFYLKGQSNDYSTALFDFDGNERSAIHLRNSDLNTLHILLQQLQGNKLPGAVRNAATNAFFGIIDRRRSGWQTMLEQLTEELDALARRNAVQSDIVAKLPKVDPADVGKGLDKVDRRVRALAALDVRYEASYRKYATTLRTLLELKRATFHPKQIKIADLIAPGAMGEANTIHQLQNYTVGLSSGGLRLEANQTLDVEASFARVNYFELLAGQIIRNNVQPKLSNRPVDFVATRIPSGALADSLPADLRPTADAVWLVGSTGKQVLILSRTDGSVRSYRYLPVADLRQSEDGKVTFRVVDWSGGVPLKYFEDPNFVATADKRSWLNEWHSEQEWLRAVHLTQYASAIIGLCEQLIHHPVPGDDVADLTADEKLMSRFRDRQRRLTEADLLILANNHWNFDVRGFNPGGNHGSFFRVSTNSTFMIAGGRATGIPRGLAVQEPYDGLSFMPTILRLMGKIDSDNRPVPELSAMGFRRFPGRVVRELTELASRAPAAK